MNNVFLDINDKIDELQGDLKEIIVLLEKIEKLLSG